MKTSRFIISALTVTCLLSVGSIAARAESTQIVDKFAVGAEIKDCEIDMKQHCQGVTPGQNRGLLCLMAYEDQLQGECKVSIIEALIAAQTGAAILDYAYEACGKDRTTICADVVAGGGRLLNCMKANQAQISAPCMTALKDTGLWDAKIEPASGN